MSRSKRSEIILEKFGSRAGMTEPGKQWVTAALDPFHDTPLNLCGFPDGSDGNSIVQLVKQSMTITAPTGITTGTWDVNIVDWPYVTTALATACSQAGNTITTGNISVLRTNNNFAMPATSGNIPSPVRQVVTGGLSISSGPTGAQLGVVGTGWNGQSGGSSYAQQNLQVDPTFLYGKHRVISKGFEVHNTTAQLYKGGSLLAYRVPVPDDTQDTTNNYYVFTSTSAYNYSFTAQTKTFQGPPETTALALLLPQSKQWNAEDGIYSVSSLHSVDIPAYEGVVKDFVIEDSGYNGNIGFYGAGALYMNTPTAISFPGSASVNVNGVQQLNFGQFDMNGCFITGLTPQTVLTINWNVYIERFPGPENPQLEVLANPAPERDNPALDFYTHASRNLPVGVPVKENGLGDWFKDVISTASDFVAPVLSMIPHPVAQGFATGIRGLNGIVNKPVGAESQPSPYQTTAQATAPLNDRGGTPYVPKNRGNTPRERVASRQRSAMAVAQVRGFNRRREANIFNNGARRNLVVATRKRFMQPMAPRRRKGGVAFTV